MSTLPVSQALQRVGGRKDGPALPSSACMRVGSDAAATSGGSHIGVPDFPHVRPASRHGQACAHGVTGEDVEHPNRASHALARELENRSWRGAYSIAHQPGAPAQGLHCSPERGGEWRSGTADDA